MNEKSHKIIDCRKAKAQKRESYFIVCIKKCSGEEEPGSKGKSVFVFSRGRARQ